MQFLFVTLLAVELAGSTAFAQFIGGMPACAQNISESAITKCGGSASDATCLCISNNYGSFFGATATPCSAEDAQAASCALLAYCAQHNLSPIGPEAAVGLNEECVPTDGGTMTIYPTISVVDYNGIPSGTPQAPIITVVAAATTDAVTEVASTTASSTAASTTAASAASSTRAAATTKNGGEAVMVNGVWVGIVIAAAAGFGALI